MTTPRLKASKANRWAKDNGCTGYTRFSQPTDRVYEINEVTLEGIGAHEVSQNMFNTIEDFTGKVMSNGVVVTPEMNADCQRYVEYVMAMVGDDDTLIVESSLPSSIPEVTPIVDSAIFNNDQLHVFEFKYGYTPVEVEGNAQMFLGADAIMKRYRLCPRNIHFHVFQPRGWHKDGTARTWTTNMSELSEFLDVARRMWDEHKTGGVCRSGNHCKDCSALLTCEASTNAMMSTLDYVSAPEWMERTGVELGEEFRLLQSMKKRLEGRIKALEQDVEHRTRIGEKTNHMFKTKNNAMQWVDKESVERYAVAIGVDIHNVPAIITPKQAIDRKLFDKETVESILASRSSSQKLIYDDGSTAKKVFS